MTDSAVIDTVLGLLFLFYALALLCSGLVEMIANWVKKRAKYLLRGIRDLLDDVPAKDTGGGREEGGSGCRTLPQTVYLNGMVEKQRYDAMLHAPSPHAATRASEDGEQAKRTTALPPDQPMHRDKITLSDVMGHPLVQPFGTRHHWASRPGIPRTFPPVFSRGLSSIC